MMFQNPDEEAAGRLIYKALHTALSPINDLEYRQLLALYRAESKFAAMVQKFASGLTLKILDVSERGMVMAPYSRESKFAVRMADMRSTGMGPDQKAALVLAHIAIGAMFFPTTDGLEDDNYSPPPVAVAQCRDVLYMLSKRLKEADILPDDIPAELAQGWQAISAMPLAVPGSQRASTSSVTGVVKLALSSMKEHGLVRLDRDSEEEAAVTYTSTFRLRVQLRELALRRLYEIAQFATTRIPEA